MYEPVVGEAVSDRGSGEVERAGEASGESSGEERGEGDDGAVETRVEDSWARVEDGESTGDAPTERLLTLRHWSMVSGCGLWRTAAAEGSGRLDGVWI